MRDFLAAARELGSLRTWLIDGLCGLAFVLALPATVIFVAVAFGVQP